MYQQITKRFGQFIARPMMFTEEKPLLSLQQINYPQQPLTQIMEKYPSVASVYISSAHSVKMWQDNKKKKKKTETGISQPCIFDVICQAYGESKDRHVYTKKKSALVLASLIALWMGWRIETAELAAKLKRHLRHMSHLLLSRSRLSCSATPNSAGFPSFRNCWFWLNVNTWYRVA